LEARAGQHLGTGEVSLGITDHAFTEVLAVLKGELKSDAGDPFRGSKNQAPGALRTERAELFVKSLAANQTEPKPAGPAQPR
jgi:hypothetical protein